jgi:putative addiction module component (TIGR02574 family)
MVDWNADALAEHMLTLPPHDRARLAELLLASLEGADPDVEAAWATEVQRRVRELEQGAVRGIPAEEVFAAVERRLRR